MTTIEVLDVISPFGVSAQGVLQALRASKGEPVEVLINSPGGDVFEGMAIYNLLRVEADRGRKVTTKVLGIAASMGSVIAMAGSEVVMCEGAIMMLHNPSGLVIGSAGDMRKEADVLDTIRAQLLRAYKRTGATEKQITAWMDAETWLDCDMAKQHRFCDRIILAPKATASAKRWDLSGFSHVPGNVTARWGLARPTTADPIVAGLVSTAIYRGYAAEARRAEMLTWDAADLRGYITHFERPTPPKVDERAAARSLAHRLIHGE